MNLAVIDTKTNVVGVYSGKTMIGQAMFASGVTHEQVEALRSDPEKFLQGLDNAA